MPIRIPTVAVKNPAQLREDYIQEHTKALEKFSKTLQAFCATHRKAYEDFLVKNEMDRLKNYLAARKANQTAYEHYVKLFDPNCHPRTGYNLVARQKANELEQWVMHLTDHPSPPPYETSTYAQQEEWRDWHKNENREPFEVKAKPNTEKIVRKEVVRLVDGIIQDFVRKSQDKVVDILVANPTYLAELSQGRFDAGLFTADVVLKFPDQEMKFRTHLIVKTNFSVLGNPYAQYPLTFHDIEVRGELVERMMSEEQIHEVFGIKKWKPPPGPPRKSKWFTVKVGDIVQVSNTINLVVATRGETATLYNTDDGERKVEGKVITEVLARTEPRDSYPLGEVDNDLSYEERKLCYVYVEPCIGKTFKLEIPREFNSQYKGLSYTACAKLTRRLAYPLLLRQIQKLLTEGT